MDETKLQVDNVVSIHSHVDTFALIKPHFEQAYKKQFKKVPKPEDVQFLKWSYDKLHEEMFQHFKGKPGLLEKYKNFDSRFIQIKKPERGVQRPMIALPREPIPERFSKAWDELLNQP